MMRFGFVVALLASMACKPPRQMGETCEEATQCGKGSDCYRGICTPMCANDGECQGELVCARHHCLLATGEAWVAPAEKPAQAADPKGTTTPTGSIQPTGPRGTTEPNGPTETTTPSAPTEPNGPTSTGNPTPPPGPEAPLAHHPGVRQRPIVGPPPSDVSSAELQKLHAEIDALRAEQRRLADEVEKLKKR